MTAPESVLPVEPSEQLQLVQLILDNTVTIKYILLYSFGALVMLIAMVVVFILFMSFKR